MMKESRAPSADDAKIAACACGGLRVRACGAPQSVYVCCCVECRRATGSVFAYRARYARSETAVEGESRVWRRVGSSGRWLEHVFCPSCGGLVFMTAEAAPDMISVSMGAFGDADFPPPRAAFWASRKPFWCEFVAETRLIDQQ